MFVGLEFESTERLPERLRLRAKACSVALLVTLHCVTVYSVTDIWPVVSSCSAVHWSSIHTHLMREASAS